MIQNIIGNEFVQVLVFHLKNIISNHLISDLRIFVYDGLYGFIYIN